MSYYDEVPPETYRHVNMAVCNHTRFICQSILTTLISKYTKKSLIEVAIEKNYHHYLHQLLRKQQTVIDDNKLCLAIRNNNLVAVRLLIKQLDGSNVLSSSTAYSEAVKYNRNHLLLELFDSKIEPNTADHDGLTACHYAINSGNLHLVKLLLTHRDINPNSRDCHGDTPCHWAIRHNRNDMLKLLINHPLTDVNVRNRQGINLAHQAITDKRDECLTSLLDHPMIDINAVDMEKRSLTHVAVQNNCVDSLKTILQYQGLDLSLVDHDNLTPCHWAMLNEYDSILKLLREYTQVKSHRYGYSISAGNQAEAAG